jgi:putative membrane protein
MKVRALAVLACLAVPAAALAQGVTDAQIASIVVTANQVDIDAGKLAVSTSKNTAVKSFGQLMVTDHAGVNKAAVDLVTKLHVTPQDNPTSQALKSGGDVNLAHLKSLKGTEFDKAYVDHEVAYHQQVLDARQDAHSRCEERRTEGFARESAAGIRCTPETREDGPGIAER